MITIKKVIFTLIILSGLTFAFALPHNADQPFSPAIVQAYAAKTCPDIVKSALQSVDQRCSSTGRNSLCYGNVQLQVTPQADAPKFTFAKPGDKTQLKNVQSLQLSSLDSDANGWGIALLRVQANLPDTAPGQNVTMLVFGNVQITDASKSAVHPTDIPTLAVSPPAPVPTVTPTTASNAASTPKATPKPTSTPRPSTTPTATPPTASTYKPIQAFYFSSGVGEPSCNEAPQDGILVQSPQGNQKIDLLIDDARVVIGSTVFLQAQAGKEMIVNTLEGSAQVSAFGQISTAYAGSRVRVPIDANLRASGPPSAPEPYDLSTMQVLPAQHLPRKVTPAAPIPTVPAGFAGSTWQVSYSTEIVSGSSSDFTCIPSTYTTQTLILATDPSGNSIWIGGTVYNGSGGSYSYGENHTVVDTNGVTHQVHGQTEFHLASPTHGDGTTAYIYTAPPPHFCRWIVAFSLDKLGVSGLPTSGATTSP